MELGKISSPAKAIDAMAAGLYCSRQKEHSEGRC